MLRIISYYIAIDTYMESFKLDRQLIIDAALILLGSFLLATGYSLFLAPAHISPGGVYGLALVIRQLLHQVFHVDLGLGTIALFFNIPLFLLAMHGLGKMSAIKTVVTFLLVALFSDLIDDWFGGRPLVEDAILCSFYGGVRVRIPWLGCSPAPSIPRSVRSSCS